MARPGKCCRQAALTSPGLMIGMLICLLLFFLYSWYGLRLDLYAYDAHGSYEDLCAAKSNKVLLVTFMRGGSSVFGEMFNQNPSSFYWFEPIDGFYSHLYGTQHGFFPLDIYYNQDKTVREIPEVELATLLQGLKNIYNCNLQELPVDVLTNSNLLNLEQESFKQYTHCLKTGKLSEATSLEPHPSSSRSCKSSLRDFCPRIFGNGQLDKCRATVLPFHEHLRENGQLITESNIPNRCLTDEATGCISQDSLSKYITCMNISHATSRPCLTLLEHSCQQAEIRAIKTIRLRVSMLKDVIAAIPDIKIVVVFRDPRGIALSREAVGLISHVGRDVMNETRLLCKRLDQELDALFQLERVHPDRVMHVRYEDFTSEPLPVVQGIYDFIEQVRPKGVSDWVPENMSGEENGGAYSTSRKNSNATAYKWRKSISPHEMSVLTASCVDALKVLKYHT